jgi:hypothetical protein
MSSPETFVKSALKTVGISDECFGYWPHTIIVLIFKFLNYLAPTLYRINMLKFYKKMDLLRSAFNKTD